MRYFAAIVLVFTFFSVSCQKTPTKSDSSNMSEENPCSPDIMCTMEFRVLNLKVQNQEGAPVNLDDFRVFIEGKEVDLSDAKKTFKVENGNYPVMTDGQMDLLSFDGNQIVFKGYSDKEEIITHEVTIGKDCCHVIWIKGDKEVQVD